MDQWSHFSSLLWHNHTVTTFPWQSNRFTFLLSCCFLLCLDYLKGIYLIHFFQEGQLPVFSTGRNANYCLFFLTLISSSSCQYEAFKYSTWWIILDTWFKGYRIESYMKIDNFLFDTAIDHGFILVNLSWEEKISKLSEGLHRLCVFQNGLNERICCLVQQNEKNSRMAQKWRMCSQCLRGIECG